MFLSENKTVYGQKQYKYIYIFNKTKNTNIVTFSYHNIYIYNDFKSSISYKSFGMDSLKKFCSNCYKIQLK